MWIFIIHNQHTLNVLRCNIFLRGKTSLTFHLHENVMLFIGCFFPTWAWAAFLQRWLNDQKFAHEAKCSMKMFELSETWQTI